MVGRIWAIALNTFREAARIRVLYGVLVVVVAANVLAAVLGQLSIHEDVRLAQDIGLAGISIMGSLTAIVLGVMLLYAEIQRRTIHAIVSKPIARWEFVVGKYVGMALVLSVLVGLFAIAMALMLTVDGDGVTMAVVKALVLAWLEVLVVAAIAIFFSSFSTPFLSGIFALAMWTLGRLTPDIEAATHAASPSIGIVARVALEIVPDLNLFAVSGHEVSGELVSVHDMFVSWGYVAEAAAHGIGWIVALVALACVLFERRDFA
jgi:ABC-type transport system involved in multi-copper enzyme maturation permease subunit|nr:ABC transporter permease [Kofleriaceae bacterium]